MKKLFLTVSFLLAVAAFNAQSLEDIIRQVHGGKQTRQDRKLQDNQDHCQDISDGNGHADGNVDEESKQDSKAVTSFNGQDIIQVFDGEKGYMINPMAGST